MRCATLGRFLSLLPFFAVVATGPALAGSYSNDRYGFSLRYPSDQLTAEPESDNGDGRRFTAGPKVTMAAFASYRQDTDTPTNVAAEAAKDCAGVPLAYRVVRRDLVAMSCTHAGTVFYRKTILGAELATTLTAEYPARGKARWDKVVAEMAASLHAPDP